jgi:hypothetical protein
MLHRQLSQWRGMCKWWTGYIGDVCNTVTVTGDLTYGTGYWVPDIEHINANFPAWMEARLINRCLIKLKKQNVNYALALAEASKSVGLIGNAFQRYGRPMGLPSASVGRVLHANWVSPNPLSKVGLRMSQDAGWNCSMGGFHSSMMFMGLTKTRAIQQLSIPSYR